MSSYIVSAFVIIFVLNLLCESHSQGLILILACVDLVNQSGSSCGRFGQSKKRGISLIEINENKDNQLFDEFTKKSVQDICSGIHNLKCSNCDDVVQSVRRNSFRLSSGILTQSKKRFISLNEFQHNNDIQFFSEYTEKNVLDICNGMQNLNYSNCDDVVPCVGMNPSRLSNTEKNMQDICKGVQNLNCLNCDDVVPCVGMDGWNGQHISQGLQNLKCLNSVDVFPFVGSDEHILQDICCGVHNLKCSNCDEAIPFAKTSPQNVARGNRNPKFGIVSKVLPDAEGVENNRNASDKLKVKHDRLRNVQPVEDILRTVDSPNSVEFSNLCGIW
ncbi:hypothetical protein RIF29_40131 [Crotalaria pallida]|uniref:Uncharacterized protein n=1 Tax=Crotalaria pallida TaxID=3830 RepID=A0AAN9E4Z9_CROPI